jgi:hypothetical protein
VQDRLGVAVGLGCALEYEVAGCLERGAGVEVRGHGVVGGVGGVLLVDDSGQSAQALGHLVAGDDAVVEPVGDQLEGGLDEAAGVRGLEAADVLVAEAVAV